MGDRAGISAPSRTIPAHTRCIGVTWIRANCPSCGDVELAAEEMSLHRHPSGDRGAYRFTCPGCLAEVDKPANRPTFALLEAAGVGPSATRTEAPVFLPALEFDDWNPDPVAPPLCMDDVIAFHFLLESNAAIADLISRA